MSLSKLTPSQHPVTIVPPNSQVVEFHRVLKPLAAAMGLDMEVSLKFKRYLEDAGYESVQERIFDLLMGDWPQDQRMKEIGRFHRFQFIDGLQSIGSALLTRMGRWSNEQAEAFFAGVRREVNNQSVHPLNKV